MYRDLLEVGKSFLTARERRKTVGANTEAALCSVYSAAFAFFFFFSKFSAHFEKMLQHVSRRIAIRMTAAITCCTVSYPAQNCTIKRSRAVGFTYIRRRVTRCVTATTASKEPTVAQTTSPLPVWDHVLGYPSRRGQNDGFVADGSAENHANTP